MNYGIVDMLCFTLLDLAIKARSIQTVTALKSECFSR